MFDYFGTLLYAIFMSLWAVFFLEFWKRYQFTLQYEWDTLDFEQITETSRPKFEATMKLKFGKANEQKKNQIYRNNPVTQKFEFYQSDTVVKTKILATLSTLLMVVFVLLAILISVIIYRAIVSPLLSSTISQISTYDTGLANTLSLTQSLIISTSGALIQLIFIMITNKFYEVIASALTRWELHKTQSDHEDSFTVKMFIFQFVNLYSSLFYIAFIKGRLITHFPGKIFNSWFYGLESCASHGCLLELTIQLIIVFILKQTLNNIIEVGKPLVTVVTKHLLSKMKLRKDNSKDTNPKHVKEHLLPPWERDYQLVCEQSHGLFWEYLELVIQFGFVTIFAAAFPLAPLFALFNNYLEIRIDAFKYLVLTRRVLANRVQDIGSWYSILDLLSKIAVVTNAFLIPFTGTYIDRIIHQSETNMPFNDSGFLSKSLQAVTIQDFIFTADFPNSDVRVLGEIIGQTTPKYTPYFYTETLYCYQKSHVCNVNNIVRVNNTTNASNCCEYLKSINNISRISNISRNNYINIGINGSACLINRKNVTCCASAVGVLKFFAINDSLINTTTSCCEGVDRMVDYKNNPSRSGIYFKRLGSDIADGGSPINGVEGVAPIIGYNNGTFNDGCLVNRVNSSAKCW